VDSLESIGYCEFECPLDANNLELLKVGNIIYKKNSSDCAVIENITLGLDVDRQEVIKIHAKSSISLLNRRIIQSATKLELKHEPMIRQLITNEIISPINTDRRITQLLLGNIKNYDTSTLSYDVERLNLLDTVLDIANLGKLKLENTLDITNKKIIIDLYQGIDRSINQSINNPIIFSTEFDNVIEQEYIVAHENEKTDIYGVGEDGISITLGNNTGINRKELFLDMANIKKESLTTAKYQELLTTHATSTLNERKKAISFNSKVNLNNYVYREDFKIGDMVTCINKKWGLTLDTYINEVEEFYNGNQINYNITFGKSAPTLIDKIKQYSI
jgi:hypothetical protein